MMERYWKIKSKVGRAAQRTEAPTTGDGMPLFTLETTGSAVQ